MTKSEGLPLHGKWAAKVKVTFLLWKVSTYGSFHCIPKIKEIATMAKGSKESPQIKHWVSYKTTLTILSI